jgi:hypothetical protein
VVKKWTRPSDDQNAEGAYPVQDQRWSSQFTTLFILGASRSGKTLLESMLSGIPTVQPLYEFIKKPPDDSGALSIEQVFHVTHDELVEHGKRVVTSTNPHSLPRLPFLADRLPNAVFVFVQRDPVDLGAEIFSKNYMQSNEYAYDPKATMAYIEAYNDASARFMERHGSHSVVLRFEDLLDDHVGAITQIGVFSADELQSINIVDSPSDQLRCSLYRAHFRALQQASPDVR